MHKKHTEPLCKQFGIIYITEHIHNLWPTNSSVWLIPKTDACTYSSKDLYSYVPASSIHYPDTHKKYILHNSTYTKYKKKMTELVYGVRTKGNDYPK